jgi:hypothetical protein
MYFSTLRIAAARYVLGRISSEELRKAADDALDEGMYTCSLGELAINSGPIMVVAGPLFEAALRELNIALPSREDATCLMLDHYIGQIAEGAIAPYAGSTNLLASCIIR